MGFLHSKWFKYLKNLVIGVGAAVVLVGALYKILSWEGANEMLMVGLLTEAGLFLMLGLLGPEKDYYWEKLYPGLDNHSSQMTPIAYESSAVPAGEINFNSEKMEGQLGGMLDHLEVMAGSLSSLKALQEADFSGASDQINKLGKFYSNLNEAMANVNDSVEDTRIYKEQLAALNENMAATNSQMKTMTTFYNSLTESTKNLSESIEDTRQYKQQLTALNKNLGALNSVYGNILSAMNPGRR
ncbi:MAG: gliding motility protein GldL [Saprospiraceae bacterium]